MPSVLLLATDKILRLLDLIFKLGQPVKCSELFDIIVQQSLNVGRNDLLDDYFLQGVSVINIVNL